MTNLTLRVPVKLKRALASAGRRHKRSQSDIAREAIAGYLQQRRASISSKARIPRRPVGYFQFDDDLTQLANQARLSFTPPNED